MSSVHFVICDSQQSVLSDGNVVRCYTPYGALPALTGPRLAYVGMPCEMLTGNYFPGNGHRTYNPGLRCFHSPDRLSPFEAEGSMHMRTAVGTLSIMLIAMAGLH